MRVGERERKERGERESEKEREGRGKKEGQKLCKVNKRMYIDK